MFIIYKVAICDDEEGFVVAFQNQVTEILKNNGIAFDITAFPSGEALLSHLNEKSADFDIFFLDIFMKEINGIATAKAIRSSNDSAAIIFTTASEQYVYSGYEVQALQYLLKPINNQTLSAALKVDLKRRFENRCFVFKSGGMTQKVPYDEIEYFESSLKSVKLVAKQGIYEIYTKISDIEEGLPKLIFCRCHRGFIINLKQVSKINAQSLTIVHGIVVPIGKTYAKATSRAFLNYIGGDGA
jgi:DNA-binding LytR/AlgR family response regulator